MFPEGLHVRNSVAFQWPAQAVAGKVLYHFLVKRKRICFSREGGTKGCKYSILLDMQVLHLLCYLGLKTSMLICYFINVS